MVLVKQDLNVVPGPGASGYHHRRTEDRPGPQRLIRCKDSGIVQNPSTERRAAGGDRPRSCGCVKMRPLRPNSQSGCYFQNDHLVQFLVTAAIPLAQAMPSGSATMALVGLFAGATVYGGRKGVNSNPAITGDIILSSRVRLRVEPSSSQRGRPLPGRCRRYSFIKHV